MEERPYNVYCVLDGENYCSGHIDKAEAEAAVKDRNARAVEMGIKARYILKVNDSALGCLPPVANSV